VRVFYLREPAQSVCEICEQFDRVFDDLGVVVISTSIGSCIQSSWVPQHQNTVGATPTRSTMHERVLVK
jgi:hypothetical protein